jgi:hypothetical protein
LGCLDIATFLNGFGNFYVKEFATSYLPFKDDTSTMPKVAMATLFFTPLEMSRNLFSCKKKIWPNLPWTFTIASFFSIWMQLVSI